jgi:hypothetical protein
VTLGSVRWKRSPRLYCRGVSVSLRNHVIFGRDMNFVTDSSDTANGTKLGTRREPLTAPRNPSDVMALGKQ